MAVPLLELARSRTALEGDALHHVQRLVESWQPVADLCFSDLLVQAPVEGDAGHRFVVLAHVRPTTGQTLYPDDLIGTLVHEVERPVVSRVWRKGEILDGDTTVLGGRERAKVRGIPVRFGGEVVAVVTRESAMTSGRRAGELERQYLEVFEHFSRMIAAGTFPFARDEVEHSDAPRVADGVIVLDADLRIRFTSPNAMSSLHRMGIHASAQGLELAELGVDLAGADEARRTGQPVTEEIERSDTSVLAQAVPLLDGEEVAGVLVLVRDVTDLRRRDRILLSKDATIREIHHRVKNNLQTIAALLHLQGRRLTSREAQEAVQESERRIRSIAIVHETLSRDTFDVVDLADVVHPLVRIVEETVASEDVRLRFEVDGHVGVVPGEVATPLAVVLNELMQNAVDHGYPRVDDDPVEGRVLVRLDRRDDDLHVDVIDDGIGLPVGFSLDESAGLGLSIVQVLVTSELDGSIEIRDDHGTHVHLVIPLRGEPEG